MEEIKVQKTKSFIQEAKTMLKSLDWKFFGVIIFALMLPIAVKTTRQIWIAEADPGAYNLFQAGMSIVIFIEMMAAFVIIPIFSFINRHSKDGLDTKRKTLIAILGSLFFCLLGLGVMMGVAWPLANSVAGDIESATGIVTIETSEAFGFFMMFGIGGMFDVLSLVFIAYVVTNRKYKWTIILATCKTLFFLVFEFLMLNPNFFVDGSIGGANTYRTGMVLMFGPIIWWMISAAFIYLSERPQWNQAFKTFSFRPHKKEFKSYLKASVFLGLETVSWNVLYYLSFVVTVWYTTPVAGNANQVFALSTMDSVYWYYASLPITATMYMLSGALSKSKSEEQDRQVLKASMLLNVFSIIIACSLVVLWVEAAVPAIANNLDASGYGDFDIAFDSAIAINTTRVAAYGMMIGFTLMWGIYRPILYYFGISGSGNKALFATLVSGILVWGPQIILNFYSLYMGVDSMNFNYVILFYSLGMIVMSIFYWALWMLENPKYKPKGKGMIANFLNGKTVSERDIDNAPDDLILAPGETGMDAVAGVVKDYDVNITNPTKRKIRRQLKKQEKENRKKL